ncbi:type II secretion system F family protein [Candidatus Daviesbacteria bacterium]|nr:type II secretion system F family protein [Candidatus Daviesbacteria bacterium]
MAIFVYKARDFQGVDHKGTIDTVDASRAARILSKKGLVVTSIIEKKDNPLLFEKIFNRVSFEELVISTRQLATMIESGLVLSESINILVGQQSNPNFRKIWEEVLRDINSGLDLASSLRKHPEVFPSLYTSLVKAGEQAGNLDVILTEMANNLERDREFRSRVRGAMVYPIMVIGMMVVVVGIMMFFVIPRLTSLYSQSDIDLPLPTKILIGSSNFLIGYWWLLLILFIMAVFAFKKWVSTPGGKFAFDEFLLKVPLVGKIIRGTSLTSFTRTFGLLTTAGVPILDSITVVSDVTNNSVYKKALLETKLGVERGLTMSAQLDEVGVFPKIVTQMYKVGEETGKVDKISFKLAEYFESEADHLVKNLTVIIEPVILIILGVGVAFLVLSIILPIYKLTTSIG